MKKLITILLLLGVFVSLAGWDGWGDPTLFKKHMVFDSTVTFNDSTFFRDAVIDSSNHVFLGKATFGDTSSYGNGILYNNDAGRLEIYGDTIAFYKTSAMPFPHWVDYCSKIYSDYDASRLVIRSEYQGNGSIAFLSDECRVDTNEVRFFRAQVYPVLDTLDKIGAGFVWSQLGVSENRWGQSWIMYQYQTDASKADTSRRWMGADTLYHESENPNKFDNDMVIDSTLYVKDSTFHGGPVIDSSNHVVIGVLTGKIKEIIKASTGNITVAECKSTLINNYGQGAANTQTLPAAAMGLNCQFVLITTGNAFHLDCQAKDKFYLDGVALDDADKISCAVPTVGDAISIMAVQTGASSYDWIARTIQGTWIDGG